MQSALHIDEKDNLVTCLRYIKKGETINIEGKDYTANADIPVFHKMAIADIKKGENCMKYGQIIGTATVDIHTGDYVHVHNCESTRGRGDRK